MSDAPFEVPSIESIAALFPAFEFDHLIAQGGMGAVYMAKQRSLDRNVAIKILPRELGNDPVFRSSFEAEAEAMAKLVHPNLITVYDSGKIDGLLYIVMEYVAGKSLFRSAHQKAVDPHQAVEIIISICRGLAEAHDHGIVHRDIKPANILLTQKREPKIGDFGLARPAGHSHGGLTMGTPGYVAPEVINHPELADKRSDIFAIGVMLCELLTGRPPENDPSPLEGITDSELVVICKKATDPNPAKRHQSASSLISDLKAWHRYPEEKKATPPPAKATTPPPTFIDRSASSALGRNIAIIIVLLAAIYGAWTLLERKKAANEAMAKQPAKPAVVQVKPTPKPHSPSATPTTSTQSPTSPMSPTPIEEPPVEAPAETPAQSLLRLRDSLAAGEFKELPVETLTKGNSYYFFVSRATTWPEANRMANAFGGHLALASEAETLTWLSQSIPEGDDTDKQATWIGATRNSSDLWQRIDASLWEVSPPQGDGEFAALNRDGSLLAEKRATTHPFFIQWHRDGSDPTDIRQILERCKPTFDTGKPIFPPGTESLGSRRLLLVTESLNYDDSSKLAELGGGKLMTVATEEEADWLEQNIKTAMKANGLWLGATLQNDLWAWTSQEPWTFARWSPLSKPGSGTALLFKPKSGWVAADPSHLASGFIIEWGNETPAEPEASPDLIAALEERAKDLLGDLKAQRNKATTENADEYVWKLDVWLRRRGNNNDITFWTPYVLNLKATVKGGRLPDDIPREPTSLYPEPLLEIAHASHVKQEAIDLGFTNKVEAIRDSYVSRLNEESTKANDLGQRERAEILSQKAQDAADIEAWIESFAITNG